MLSYGLVIVSPIVSFVIIGGFGTRGGQPINSVDTKSKINKIFNIFFISHYYLFVNNQFIQF